MLLAMATMFFIITFVMMMMASALSKKTSPDREKSSPFECGFDPKMSARIPFSIQFFLIAVIFLIFDVEITLLIPLILTTKSTNFMNYMMLTSLFIAILIAGTIHEWKQGALDWMN
uniref:NADH-ubiquinone oxidoreductase chain 3 n=1 Tax=Bostrichoidea sp. 3 KM-2017 TaxID=2219277 RepID=A0A346RH83_9COLE|nr:NADH dehydrogenase subunit 3 [Bostrichoidea sp. 3 KM-2017]